jgi:hypothetical protein
MEGRRLPYEPLKTPIYLLVECKTEDGVEYHRPLVVNGPDGKGFVVDDDEDEIRASAHALHAFGVFDEVFAQGVEVRANIYQHMRDLDAVVDEWRRDETYANLQGFYSRFTEETYCFTDWDHIQNEHPPSLGTMRFACPQDETHMVGFISLEDLLLKRRTLEPCRICGSELVSTSMELNSLDDDEEDNEDV